MSTKKAAAKKATLTIEDIIRRDYGVEEAQADAIVVEWAANKLALETSAKEAGKQWRKLNAKRGREGRRISIPQWGTEIWAGYFDRPWKPELANVVNNLQGVR